jgi:hypothetical protein
LNDGSVGIYVRTPAAGENKNVLGVTDASTYQISLRLRSDPANTIISRFNDGTNVETDTVQNATGFWIMNRTGESAYTIIKNNVTKMSCTTTSTGVPDAELYLLSRNANGSPFQYAVSQISMFYIGESFDATEIRKINNCFEYYMDSIGKGVQ